MAVRTADLIPLDDLAQVAECLRVLAHPYRLRIVEMLLAEELPVTAIAERCGLSQPAVSIHLRLLQARGLRGERRGRTIIYQIATPALDDILACIRTHFASCPAATARRKSRS